MTLRHRMPSDATSLEPGTEGMGSADWHVCRRVPSHPAGRHVTGRSWPMLFAILLLGLALGQPATANERLGSAFSESPRMTPAVRAVRRAAPSVVNIHTVKFTHDDMAVFGSAGGRKVNGMGTGIIIDPRGYIATNHHVVKNVESLTCTLQDGTTFDAKVIAVDPKRDLAIIKVEPVRDLPVIPLGTSSDLMLCETVIAIGNAFGYEHTVTKGIISALHRNVEVNETQSYKNLIQTDASINPGNSGGPLLNLAGEVIGINVAIRAGAQRIGFALPIDDARLALADLMNIKDLRDTTHGLLTRDVKTSSELDLLVTGCEKSSPAQAAGFQPGDVIMQVAGHKVRDRVDLERFLLDRDAGESVHVLVERNGHEETLTLRLAEAVPDARRVIAQTSSAAARPSRTTQQHTQPASHDDAAWRILGLRLIVAPQSAVAGTHYAGGLEVVAVRSDSPAAHAGIQAGDILVGLHDWSTVKQSDVEWVLQHPRLNSFSPLLFYVLGDRGEGQKTLSGRLALANGK